MDTRQFIGILVPCLMLSSGMITGGLGAAMMSGKIPRNPWLGFRTPKTLSDPDIWQKANRYTGRDFLVFGILHWAIYVPFLVLGIAGRPLRPDIIAFSAIATVGAGLCIIVPRALWYVHKL